MPYTLQSALNARFTDAPTTPIESETLFSMAARGSCRAFTDEAIPDALLHTLCAVALSAPSKSDLQQRDIVVLKDQGKRADLAKLVSGQPWITDAPMMLVFCGNNRRQRLLHDWRSVPFANDHCDAPFNAIADAAIALGAFVAAAEAVGLGCCPISAVRNDAAAVSHLLGLPDHVFPFAGLALGYPARKPDISPRLPLGVIVHTNTYSEAGLHKAITDYDTHRAEVQPYTKQRLTEMFGHSITYTWSEDKVRQYSSPERAGFGAYMRAVGFTFQ